MTPDEIVREYEVAKRDHRIGRWSNLVLSILLIIAGLASIHVPWLQDLWSSVEMSVLAPVGAALLIAGLRKWTGDRKLHALREAVIEIRGPADI